MEPAITLSSAMPAEKKRLIDTINTYSKRLFSFIRSRVNSEEDAEDILQDVFFQFVGNADPVTELSGWLFRVARNKITDNYRKKRPELIDDIEFENELANKENPEIIFQREMFWEHLDEVLKELPEEQREVFILHELDGIPFKEIAEITGVPVNTLISRKRYAVLELRKKLELF